MSANFFIIFYFSHCKGRGGRNSKPTSTSPKANACKVMVLAWVFGLDSSMGTQRLSFKQIKMGSHRVLSKKRGVSFHKPNFMLHIIQYCAKSGTRNRSLFNALLPFIVASSVVQ